MSRTKTAKAVEMLFGLWIEDLGGPREPYMGVHGPPWEMGNFVGVELAAHCEI